MHQRLLLRACTVRPILCGLIAAALLGLSGQRARAEGGDGAGAADVGATFWIGEQYFQLLGRDPQGRECWLYPHLDGVPEVFRAPAEADGPARADAQRARWAGSLGSSFDPARGTFSIRFNAVEAHNELHARRSSREARRDAARALFLYLALHPGGAPYPLADDRRAVERALTRSDERELAAELTELRALLARASAAGTSVIAPPAALRSAEDHHRALLADGYLDVAVVGGNSNDGEGATLSGRLVELVGEDLRGMGFARAAFRGSRVEALRERTIQAFGRPIKVRVLLAGGSHEEEGARRTVAAFVEGLAHADVVIYLGHSNQDTGRYYLDEGRSRLGRFHVGLGGAPDLAEKCHGLGERPQLLVLNSCWSFEKYCRPATTALEGAGVAALPGFVGTADKSYFDEFVPRTRALFRALLAQAGPQALAAALDEAKPRADAAPLILRGALQPRASFVLPPGVTVTSTRRLGAEASFLLEGEGSDGRRYVSTDAFPQDVPGDVVQVVAFARGAYGLGRDGVLYRVGPETLGACRAEPLAKGIQGRFLTVVRPGSTRRGSGQLCLIDAQGRVHVLRGRPERFEAMLPAAAPLVALGQDVGGALVALDAQGRAYRWRTHPDRWEPVDVDEPVALEAPTPSLLATNVPGLLWLAGAPAPLDVELAWAAEARAPNDRVRARPRAEPAPR